jgi:hypothetical protein
MIDEDIIAQLGFTSLDDYIGDPSDTDAKSYPDLIQRATNIGKNMQSKMILMRILICLLYLIYHSLNS